jgi:calmodulin
MDESTTVSEFDQMLSYFNSFDKNKDGLIDYDEFESLVAALGKKTNEEQRRAGFTLIDTDQSGHIEFSEFMNWWGNK